MKTKIYIKVPAINNKYLSTKIVKYIPKKNKEKKTRFNKFL